MGIGAEEACGNCRFFRSVRSGHLTPEQARAAARFGVHDGECRRFPETAWKEPASWCGEWRPAAKEGGKR